MAHKPTRKIILRYTLLELPMTIVFALVLYMLYVLENPYTIWMGIFIVFWVLKEIVMFPFVWRSYDTDAGKQSIPLIGTHGIAMDNLNPEGHVQVHGVQWKAKLMDETEMVAKGQPVKIKNIENITLVVESVAPDNHI